VILSKYHRPPPPNVTTKGRRPDTSSNGYTAFKIAFKVMLIALVLCVALLPAATVKNSRVIHSALVALEPTIDTVKFDVLAKVDAHQGLLRKRSNPLVDPPEDYETGVGFELLDDCTIDCLSKQHGYTEFMFICPPRSWMELDNKIDIFIELGQQCAQPCNSTGFNDIGRISPSCTQI
jgi:hypothetical protein